MSTEQPALVVYAGQMATYVCEGGDVQPTYPIEQPITEEVLRLLCQDQPALTTSPPLVPAVAPASGAAHASSDRAVHGRRRAERLRRLFLPLLAHRFIVLVVPLSSATAYREEWTRLCFHSSVQARRLVVLADTVACAFACGIDGGLVLHASLNTVALCRVEAGCSTRYSNSQMGSVHMLCGASVAAKLTESWPDVAVKLAHPSTDTSSTEYGGTLAGESAADEVLSGSIGAAPDLAAAEYRDAVIRAFGYRAYVAVVLRAQVAAQLRQQRQSQAGSGKGKGRQRQREPSLRQALDALYPRPIRRAPGQLEKLLVRVVQGEPAAGGHDGEPCVLAGEALAIPHVRELLEYVVRHCGERLWRVVERERRRLRRSRHAAHAGEGTRRSSARTEKSVEAAGTRGAARARATPDTAEAATSYRRRHSESSYGSGNSADTSESEDSSASTSSGDGDSSSASAASSSASSRTEGDASDDEDEEDAWLHTQPTPLPSAPWWLPLLGGSVVSRLTEQDLQRAVIYEDEAMESNGTVVHWRMLQ